MKQITLTIDGKTITTDAEKSILDVCIDNGIYIPHLCSHPDLRPVGSCGLCVVEIEGRKDLVSSCVTIAEEGMSINTSGTEIKEARVSAMEEKLKGHPADCDSCIKYLNCELQSLKQLIIGENLRVQRKLRMFKENSDNPIFVHNPTKCVQCGRCVRACHELRDVGVLYFKKEGNETYVGINAERTEIKNPDTIFEEINEELMQYTSEGKDVSLAEADCRFCGACAEVCPTGAIMDKYEFGEGKSKKDALVPCSATCPAGIDIPLYIRLIKEKRYSEASAVIREKTPFPLSLGHVCSRPCEGECRRGYINEAVSIRELKRFALTNEKESLWKEKYVRKPETEKKIAIIGSGPAGLSAAFYLNMLGHSVRIFEEKAQPGGMLRYGIPEYRLPTEVLNKEINQIIETGIAIETDTKIESVNSLIEKNYDAILVAIGTQKGIKLRLRGGMDNGILINTDFLRSAREGNPQEIGKKVLVLGGGNVAFDCARVAKRLGADTVEVAFLEPEENMLASADEIMQAKEEGVALHPSVTFKRIQRDNDDNLIGISVLDVSEFSFDEEKRLQVETIENSEHVIEADTVIFAVGQKPDIPENFGPELTASGYIAVDQYTMQTSMEGVFAASDAVYGTDSVVRASESGRKVALAIDKYLGGRGRIKEIFNPEFEYKKNIGKIQGFASNKREREKCIPLDDRICSSLCVTETMSYESAEKESQRCLQCDLRLKMTSVKFWGSY